MDNKKIYNSLPDISNLKIRNNQTKTKAKSLPNKSYVLKTPTPIKFSDSVNKILKIKTLLHNNLPKDLSSRIITTAYTSKFNEYEKDNNEKFILLNKELSKIPLKKIINTFELNNFNFNYTEYYKDNEEILTDISSSVSGDTDFEYFYSFRKIQKLDNINKLNNMDYEIVLVKIPIHQGNINENESEIYERKFFKNKNSEGKDIIRYIEDNNNHEIIRKLKYRDLINIFNPELNTYSKVVKKLKSLV